MQPLQVLDPAVLPPDPPLELRRQLTGKNLIVVGGTGFLGKVWLALVLTRVPDVGQIYLVVRPKDGLDAVERFRQKILSSEVFGPLRATHGDAFDSFVRSKVTPIAGDISEDQCGLDEQLIASIQGRVAAIVNVAGIVDFDPPLDEALRVNSLGCRNLVQLAVALGHCPLLHTSTCFTAGSRTGTIEEVDPRAIPFPYAAQLGTGAWNVEREVAECVALIELTKKRADELGWRARFQEQARAALQERGDAVGDAGLEAEATRFRQKFLRKQLSFLGMERSRHWGWPNTYTYTKSLGEQIVAGSGLPFTIVRPAIVESTLAFPFPGWNEGINTSSPFIFLIRQGGLQVPGSSNNLDLIPCDLVCTAILLALAELIEGRASPVYQAAASDLNPCTMARFFELSGLHKRSLYAKTRKGGPVVSAIQKHFESILINKQEYESYGPRALGRGAERAGHWLRKVARGPLRSAMAPLARGLEDFAAQQQRLARVMDTFLPFVAEYQYVFRATQVRRAFARLSLEEQRLFPWHPEQIDWRHWFLEIHAPALERHVFPQMEARLKR